MIRPIELRGHPRTLPVVLTAAALVSAGCMVGPDYSRPPAPVATQWRDDPAARPPSTQPSTPAADERVRVDWWKAFNDPALDRLVETAYRQNLPLQIAGLRVLEARAARGIAVGQFFPQAQQLGADYAHVGASRNNAVKTSPRFFDATSVGFDAAWELDAWGKFRRGIESADAAVYASVMNYDDALVTLVADVAANYINLRGLDERIRLANENVRVQQNALDIANVRFRAGGTTELDVQQARAQLTDTQALIPPLEQARRQTENRLCVLLGLPPIDLAEIIGSEPGPIPEPPASIATGIPADLLRRRPDIRRAEGAAASQSALIGVAVADLLPHFQLFGSIGYSAENAGDLFNESSLNYQVGPGIRWDILNYGRIKNNVRVQDARFEQLLTAYQDTVLAAQRDVADSIIALVRSREQAGYLSESVSAALRAVELSLTQYRAGGADFIRVLNATAILVQEQDRLVVSRTNIATSAVSLNRALGGGWELRGNSEFVPPETIDRMRRRTNWGDVTRTDYDRTSDMLVFPRSTTTTLPQPKGK